MLGRLRIGPKLLLAPGLVLLLLIISSCGAYYAMVRQNQSLETIVQQRAARIRDATDLVNEAQGAHSRIYQLISWISGSFSAARIDALVTDLHRRHRAVDSRFAQLTRHTAPGSAERRFLEQSEAAQALYVRAVLDVIELAQTDQSIGANAMIKAERAFDTVAQRLAELARLEQELAEQASQRAADDFRLITTLMPVLVALSIVLSLAITVAVRRALLREVDEIGAAALGLARGHLTVRQRAYGRDEISDTARALDTSIRNLNVTLRNILDSAEHMDSASREIALGNADLSSRTEVQACSLEQTSATMEQLSATVHQTADNAQAANRLAESASSMAQQGGSMVDRLVQTMASIKGSACKVADIVEQIDDIAGQTHVLALNAAVEAARAGESGRNFAMVAGEVRVLAQRSASAARDIRSLVRQSVAEIDAGNAAAAAAGHSMAGLADSVREVGAMISQISDASAEQAIGIVDVNHAIVQMDQMTQQNSALVEQAAAAAESLQDQASQLARAVAGFKLDEAVPEASALRGARPRLRLASSRDA